MSTNIKSEEINELKQQHTGYVAYMLARRNNNNIELLSKFMLDFSATATANDKVHILNSIASNKYITDAESVIKFEMLSFNYGDDVDTYNSKIGISPLFHAINNSKPRLAEALIKAGAKLFAAHCPNGHLRRLALTTEYSLVSNWQINSIKARTPFNLLLENKAPKALLAGYINQQFKHVTTVAEIVIMPINKLAQMNLLTDTHCEILANVILSELQDAALDQTSKLILKEFLQHKDLAIANYKNLNRLVVAAQIINFIKYPYTQDQLDYNLCGANAFFISIAMQAPNLFVHMVIGLLNNGSVAYPIKLEANAIIQENCTDVALLLYQSLKNSDLQATSPYNPQARTYFRDLTTPEELVRWLQLLSCEAIKDCTQVNESIAKIWQPIVGWLYPRGLHNLNMRDVASFDQQLQRAIEQVNQHYFSNILYIKIGFLYKMLHIYANVKELEAKVIYYVTKMFSPGLVGINVDHYVVLKDIAFDKDDPSYINMRIYTWGLDLKFRVTVEELRGNWAGLLSYKFPATLSNMSGADLNAVEQAIVEAAMSRGDTQIARFTPQAS